jgi:hypothetical protein
MDASVWVIEPADLSGTRRNLLLAEDRVGHYEEFRDFLRRTFKLDQIGLARPGYVQTTSGAIYEFVFVGRSGEPFPSGVEVSAVVEALEPLDETQADLDLWAILRWIVANAGEPWTVDDLNATGRLLRIPAALRG